MEAYDLHAFPPHPPSRMCWRCCPGGAIWHPVWHRDQRLSPDWMRDIELDEHGLLEFFRSAAFRRRMWGIFKPHPAIYRAALHSLNVTPQETIFIGDNLEADIGGGTRPGCAGVLRVNDSGNPLRPQKGETRCDDNQSC